MDQRVVESSFYHKSFDIFEFRHPLARVSKRPNKESFAKKMFQFGRLSTQQRSLLQKEWIFPKAINFFCSTVCATSSELSEEIASMYRFLYQFSELSLDLQNKKQSLSSLKNPIPNRENCLPFWFENNIYCVFSVEKLELHVSQLILTKNRKLNHRKNGQLQNNC